MAMSTFVLIYYIKCFVLYLKARTYIILSVEQPVCYCKTSLFPLNINLIYKTQHKAAADGSFGPVGPPFGSAKNVNEKERNEEKENETTLSSR